MMALRLGHDPRQVPLLPRHQHPSGAVVTIARRHRLRFSPTASPNQRLRGLRMSGLAPLQCGPGRARGTRHALAAVAPRRRRSPDSCPTARRAAPRAVVQRGLAPPSAAALARHRRFAGREAAPPGHGRPVAARRRPDSPSPSTFALGLLVRLSPPRRTPRRLRHRPHVDVGPPVPTRCCCSPSGRDLADLARRVASPSRHAMALLSRGDPRRRWRRRPRTSRARTRRAAGRARIPGSDTFCHSRHAGAHAAGIRHRLYAVSSRQR